MMKKIIVLCFLVFLASCNNPFDKYKDSVDKLKEALEASKAIEKEVADIQAQIDRISASGTQTFDQTNISEIYTSLQTISTNMDNPIVQSVLQNYLEQNNISLSSDVAQLKTDLSSIPEFSSYAGTNPSKAEVTTLFTSLVTKIQSLQ